MNLLLYSGLALQYKDTPLTLAIRLERTSMALKLLDLATEEEEGRDVRVDVLKKVMANDWAYHVRLRAFPLIVNTLYYPLIVTF